jgi:hypothetical protein
MEYNDFYEAIQSLKDFIEEQDKLDAVLKVISPTSTGVCEFGNKFIDDYIRILEIALGDTNQWVSWFVFENDFGNKKFEVRVNDIEYEISNEREFFDVCILNVT